MVAMYTIAGRQIGSHWLAMATLGATVGIATISMRGSSAKNAQGPPINAQSPDEEKFVKEFIANAEAQGKNSNGHSSDTTKKDTGR